MEKRISIVIPVYNAERSLQKCLDSIFSSNYKNFEVIIINDCSSDNSVEIAKKYHCKIINLSERRGPAFARNKGIALADGKIVAFLDSDCIAPKNWLGKINTKLIHDIAGIGGKYDFRKDVNMVFLLLVAYWCPKFFFYGKPRSIISLSGGNCAFWKPILLQKREKKELVFYNKLVGGEDVAMCCELRKFGKLIYDPDLSVLHDKKCSLFDALKLTIAYGYTGVSTTRLCSNLLIKEPHRLYKASLYLLSLFLFFSVLALPLTGVHTLHIGLFAFYILVQLPLILLLHKNFVKGIYPIFFPVVTFVADVFYFLGHLKKGLNVIQKTIDSFFWRVNFLINILKPRALSKIFFFVTKKCNANCYFCFNKKMDKYQIGQKSNDLSLEEIENITTKIGFLPWLIITGGEPFLRKELREICKLFYYNCKTRVITVVTNGLLPKRTEEIVEELLIDCEKLDLSILIALDDITDKCDHIKGVSGACQQALNTLEKMNDLQLRFPRLSLGINTMLIKENAGHIEEILDYFRNNLKYDRQNLNLLRQPAHTSIAPKLISMQKYFDLVLTKTFNGKITHLPYSIKQRFHQAALKYNCERALEEFNLKKSLSTCLAAQKFLVINNNGAIFPCELLTGELGNLRNEGYDLRKIINGSKTKNLRLKIKNTNCYCQWSCAIIANGYCKISSYPKILKNMI